VQEGLKAAQGLRVRSRIEIEGEIRRQAEGPGFQSKMAGVAEPERNFLQF
jgi:hypothetical protein